MIKAVIFDIDGVLLDSFEANLKFFQDLMNKTGYRSPTREEFPAIFHLSMMDAIKTLTKSNSEEEIKRIWEMGRSREVGYDLGLLAMPKGAGKVIETLSKNYQLGIVTSRIKESVYESPKLTKLKKYFKVAVSYEDTTNHKPHPEPLLLAAQKLGVRSEECIYIGDVENDIKAACAAGMKVIIYSKNNFPQANICTTSFIELPELIASLSQTNTNNVVWVNENDNELGVITRKKAHREGLIQFEPKSEKTLPDFKPRDGQVDYTNIRYAPVINCVVRYNGTILIVQRNPKMRLYPNFWNGISGFLDDGRSIEQKVKDELHEELGIKERDIVSIHRGPVFNQEEEKYSKTWIVHPILVDVKTDKIKLDWEAQNYKWIKVEDAKTFDLLPGFDKVLMSLFHK